MEETNWLFDEMFQKVYPSDIQELEPYKGIVKDDLDTLLGDIYSEGDYLYLDYPVLCNIDFDILKVLKEWFGENNVEATW